MRPREGSSPAHVARTVESGIAVAVRRPKPLIPLNTALDNVNNSSNTSLSWIPAVLMLTRMASARIGERITSITTDARFLVVFDFIRFVCSPVDARQCCFATCMTVTTGVPLDHCWIYEGFAGPAGSICRPRLTSSSGPSGVKELACVMNVGNYGRSLFVARS